MWALNSPDVRASVGSSIKGVGRPRINLGDLRRLQLPVAPAAEQERIVTAIEEAFSKLDAGEAGLRTVRQLLRRMRDAILTAAATGRLVPQDPTNTPAAKLLADLGVEQALGMYEVPDSWAWTRLGAMLQEPMRNGMSAVKADSSEGLPTFSITAVTTGDFSDKNIKYTAGDWNRASDLWAEAGDLFVQRSNTPELVGTARLYRGTPRAAIFPDLLIRVRAVPQLRPEWLELFMGSPRCRAFVRSQAKGLAGSMPKISQPVLDRLEVPVPPEGEQDRIVTEVERQISFVEACERAVDVGLARSAGLRRSVLKAAFEGRLVPQDPSDEPASVLLDRIRAERAAHPVAKRRAGQTA
jgi:type I restriction enzyme S subunit